MRNKDHWPQPYTLATATNGTLSVAGLSLGATSSDGAVVCVRTSGGTMVTLGAPGAQTDATVAAPTATDASDDESDDS